MEPVMNTPRVIGDIGGTNARFAIAEDGKYSQVKHVETEHYPSLHDALADYLNAQPHGELSGALAIAGPVLGDRISLTNKAWSFSIEDLKQSLNLTTLTVVNDFAATAQAIPHLSPQQKFAIGPAIANAKGNIGIVGPGTGFGMSSLIPHGAGWTQRVLSGAGLVNLYEALCALRGVEPLMLTPADVTRRAMDRSDETCVRAFDHFCEFLGSVAGDLALTISAFGGVYIAGGILPRFKEAFAASAFRERFEAKGRFASMLAKMPTWLILEESPALIGLANMPLE
jgi:glucokinase